MRRDVLLVLEEPVADELPGIGGARAQLRRRSITDRQTSDTGQVVHHRHVEWSGGRAFFFVAAHVPDSGGSAAIGQAMDEQWIAVKGEDDGLSLVRARRTLCRSGRAGVRSAVGAHQVNYVNHPDFQCGKMPRSSSTAARVSSVGTSPRAPEEHPFAVLDQFAGPRQMRCRRCSV